VTAPALDYTGLTFNPTGPPSEDPDDIEVNFHNGDIEVNFHADDATKKSTSSVSGSIKPQHDICL